MTQKNLDAIAREERNRYAREWRAKNKDKVRETNRKYWEKRALKLFEASKKKEGSQCEE